MVVGHDEDVAWVDGLDVHERGAAGVARHDARGQAAGEYSAEDATVHARHYGTANRSASDRLRGEMDGDLQAPAGPRGCYFRVYMLLFDRSKGL